MNIVDRIDRLFDDDEPTHDESGILTALATALGDLRPRVLIQTGSTGTIDRIHHIGTPKLPTAELRRFLARALSASGEDTEDAPHAWVVRSAEAGGVVVAGCDRAPRDVPRERLEEFTIFARISLRTLALIDDRQQLRRRVLQLQNEHGTLSDFHDRTVTELLETKEQQARSQTEHVEHLEAEVRRRSTALSEALEQAEAASRTKSAFLANMSHEFRTPLTAILGFADLLLEPDLRLEDVAGHADVIRSNGSQLLELMNDVLDATRLENHELLLEESRFDLAEVLREVVEEFRDQAEGMGIRIVATIEADDTEMTSDLGRVRQILRNLVDNAVKFTERGEVRVTVGSRRVGESEYSLIEVGDTGIGMTPQELESAFQLFTQIDSSYTRRFSGTGLGLSISRNLARLLGGEIAATSEPGVGSVFQVMLRRQGTSSNDAATFRQSMTAARDLLPRSSRD